MSKIPHHCFFHCWPKTLFRISCLVVPIMHYTMSHFCHDLFFAIYLSFVTVDELKINEFQQKMSPWVNGYSCSTVAQNMQALFSGCFWFLFFIVWVSNGIGIETF